MSRLEELIQELCPDGVEYKTLGEIAVDIYRGAGITRDQVTETGIPCVRYGEIYTTYGVWFEKCISHTDEDNITNKKYFEYGDILFAITGESVEDIAKSCAYIGHEKCLAGGDIVVLKHNQNPKYLAYVLSTTEAKKQKSQGKVKSKVVHSSVPAIKNIQVPIPPLPVQSEIVQILDNFTEITEELIAELTAEFTSREKQYKFYRDTLFSAFSSAEYKTLPDISLNCDRQRKPITKGKRNAGEYPYYGASGIVDYIEDYIFDGDYLLISEDGANLLARSSPIAFSISGKNWVNNHAHVIQFDSIEMQKFVEIYMNSIDLSKYISGGAQPKLNQDNLNKIPIPVPSFDRVKETVDVLTKFDFFCNDLTNRLSAEIGARQKQYEYYRDKLLTFKELKENSD